jgi:DNA-binding transcriptional regulator LsrR (DeoR family)
LDDRIIGLNLDEFRKIQHKVAIAFTPRKVKAILAAMRGRYLDVLITDEKTAVDLLNRS